MRKLSELANAQYDENGKSNVTKEKDLIKECFESFRKVNLRNLINKSINSMNIRYKSNLEY